MEQESDSNVQLWDGCNQFEYDTSSYSRFPVTSSVTWSLMIKAYVVSFLLLASVLAWTAGDACFSFGRSYLLEYTTFPLFNSYINYTHFVIEFG